MRYLPLIAVAALAATAAVPAMAQERNVGNTSIQALEPPVDVRASQVYGPGALVVVPFEGRSVFRAGTSILGDRDLTDGQ